MTKCLKINYFFFYLGLGRVDGLILDSPFHSFKKAFLQITPTFLLPYIDIEAFVTDIDMEFDNVKVKINISFVEALR